MRTESSRRILIRPRAVSLFSCSVEQSARDTQMTTRVTEGARRERHSNYFLLGLPPSLLASRVSRLASRVSRLASRVSRLASRVSCLASRVSRLASRGFAAQRSRARALPLPDLKKKRDCSQSTFWSLVKTIEQSKYKFTSFLFFKCIYCQMVSARH